MRREGARQLVVTEALEEARRREVPLAAIAAGKAGVGDLTDERLHEAVLAAFWERGRRVQLEDLAPDQVAKARPSSSTGAPATAASAGTAKVWPRTAASATRERAAGSSASIRAAIRACSVAGTSRSPRSPAAT